MIQAGAVGLLGLGMNHLAPLRQAGAAAGAKRTKAKSVIYIFLSGGLGQQDSFDPKPNAPANTRGEFQPIATKTPGVQVCEHLPLLAACSDKWALVRSLTHPYNEHSNGHMVMLSGRTPMPPGFDPGKPRPADWPSIAAVAGDALLPANNLPPAVVLPERLVHRTGRVIPGQFAGIMGSHRDPWFIAASPFNGKTYGAYPAVRIPSRNRQDRKQAPVSSSESLAAGGSLLPATDRPHRPPRPPRPAAERTRNSRPGGKTRSRPPERHFAPLRLAHASRVRRVARGSTRFRNATAKTPSAGRCSWPGNWWRQGVSLVQVNLGNNESWDTHESAFPNLKNYLLPPTDRAVSALIGDLDERGLLGRYADCDGGRIRPDAASLRRSRQAPGPRPLGCGANGLLRRRRCQRRHGDRVLRPDRRLSGERSANSRSKLAATIYNALGISRHGCVAGRGEPPAPHLSRNADRRIDAKIYPCFHRHAHAPSPTRTFPAGRWSRPERSACSGWDEPPGRPSGPRRPPGRELPLRWKAKTCIYIFLSGGLAQHDSFDMKPDGPGQHPRRVQADRHEDAGHPDLRAPAACWPSGATCGLSVRSLTHPSNDHSLGHHIMLTGRTPAAARLQPQRAAADRLAEHRRRRGRRHAACANNLPPAVVLPERLVHYTGRVIPGQFAGVMGPHRDPWFIEASPFDSTSYGAYPAVRVRPSGAAGKRRQASLPGAQPVAAAGDGRPAASPAAPASSRASPHQRQELDGFAQTREFRPLPAGGDFAAHRRQGAAGLRRHAAPTTRRRTATATTPSAGRC